jgi:hypothetical protein
MKPSSSLMLHAILNPPLSQFWVAATPPPLEESRNPEYRVVAFAASGRSITAATAKNNTARFPGRSFMFFSFRSGRAEGAATCHLRFDLLDSSYKKNRVAVLSLWQPGYLQETRGFPSLPCGKFGFYDFRKI